MEEQLKEMLGKRPDELEGETLKLFNAIMKIANERDKLREENKALKTRKIIGRIDEINIEDLEDILSLYYIPKSKVKEKIEWLEKNIIDNPYSRGSNLDNAEYQIDILQELLED